MKNIIKLMCGLMLCTGLAYGQRFQKAFEAVLPEPLSNVQMEWVAIDSDTLLDLVVAGVSADGQLKIMTFKNKLTSIQYSTTQITGFKSGYFQLTDWNNDNGIDLLISGKTTVNTNALFVFQNNGDFTFQKNGNKLSDQGSPFRIADFNEDGRPDVLFFGVKGGQLLSLYQNTTTGLQLRYDSANLDVQDIVVADFNNDGHSDFVVSGQTNALAPVTTLFLAKDKFGFKTVPLQNPVNGKLSAIDRNADGNVDLIAIGKTIAAVGEQIWYNDGKTLTPQASSGAPTNAFLFSGDFDSDGIADLLINGKDVSGRKVNFIQQSASVLSLDTTGLITQRAGDFDRDGDLDIAQLKDSVGQQWIKVLKANVAVVNLRPPLPSSTFAISTFGKTFIYWKGQADDHTATASLTYDVWLGGSTGTVVSPPFSLSKSPRQLVIAGNSGTRSSKIVRGLPNGEYHYLIQAVDNAYNGSLFGGGGVLPCFDLSSVNVNACKDHPVTLTAAENAYWFSSSSGFLATGADYNFVASQNDTLFSFVPQGLDCSKNKVWIVSVFALKDLADKETRYVCEGATIKLGIAPGWKNIEWNTSPVTTGVDTLTLAAKEGQVITVKATADTGCPYTKEFTIHLSKPTLTLNGESFRTAKGNPVQLIATGTSRLYHWSPATGLSNAAVSNPIAAPAETTSYTVTGTDSVGCVITGKVLIQVEFTAFVPNLFTPNGDNKNDVLLVYGLAPVADFRFQIFNREGSVVYETSDVQQAGSSGWNGSLRGTLQPSGVYYWKVEGSLPGGERLLLNGKKTGSILLVH